MEKRVEIDFKRLFIEIMLKSWIIILVAVLMGFALFMYAKTKITPQYSASASLYVNNYIKPENSDISRISSNDLATSQRLVQTYLTFLRSDQVLDSIAEQLDGEFSGGMISGMLSASALNQTEVFQITITYSDPQVAADIVNIIADVAPGVITQYIEGSSVKVVDYAKVPTTRSSPVYRKYIILGFVAGGGLAAIIVILMFLFNSKISSEDDIKKLFTAPVIGKIPNFEQRPTSNSTYNYGYGYRNKE